MSSYLRKLSRKLKRKESVSVAHSHTCDNCFRDLPASQFDFSYYGFVCFACAKHLCDGCAFFVKEELEPDYNGDKLCCKCKDELEKEDLGFDN
jgi:hypothetical protein